MLVAGSLLSPELAAQTETEVVDEAHPTEDATQPGTLRRTLDASAALLKHTVVDAAGIVFSPLQWRTKEWLCVGAVGGAATLLVLYADKPIRNLARANSGFRKFGKKIQPLAAAPGIAALTGGMFLSGLILDREKDRETARLMIESGAIGYLIGASLKHTLGRARPHQRRGNRDFDLFGKSKSMPSGEVTLAFGLATVIASQYEGHWLKLGVYSLAAAVAAGRIANDSHWTSDTLVSAALGTAIASSVMFRHHRRLDAKANQPRWQFGLTLTGIQYRYSW